MGWFLSLALLMAAAANSTYESRILKWRQEREAKLKAPDGWLSLAGLEWLKPGRNQAPREPGSPRRRLVHPDR
jgi:uncharacterized protein